MVKHQTTSEQLHSHFTPVNSKYVVTEGDDTFEIDFDGRVLDFNGKKYSFEFLEAFFDSNKENTYLIKQGKVTTVELQK
jgi:hypothetical protein